MATSNTDFPSSFAIAREGSNPTKTPIYVEPLWLTIRKAIEEALDGVWAYPFPPREEGEEYEHSDYNDFLIDDTFNLNEVAIKVEAAVLKAQS